MSYSIQCPGCKHDISGHNSATIYGLCSGSVIAGVYDGTDVPRTVGCGCSISYRDLHHYAVSKNAYKQDIPEPPTVPMVAAEKAQPTFMQRVLEALKNG